MRKLAFFGVVFTACVSTPRSQYTNHALLKGVTVEEVRLAARAVLENIAPPRGSIIRITDDRVLAEGRIGVCGHDVACGGGTVHIGQNVGTPWATVQVRILGLGNETAIKVDIEYETTSHCRDRYADVAEVSCLPEPLGSTGVLEHRIIEGVRAQLLNGKDGITEPPLKRRGGWPLIRTWRGGED